MTNRRVRFADHVSNTAPDEIDISDRKEKKQNPAVSDRSLLTDSSNHTSVTPFNLDEELADESLSGRLAADSTTERSGDGDEEDEDDGYGAGVGAGDDSSDDDVQPIEDVHELRRRRRAEEDNWDDEEVDNSETSPEKVGKSHARKRQRRETSPMHEVDAVGLLVGFMHPHETVSQAIQRATETNLNDVTEAYQVLGNVSKCCRNELIRRVSKWELCWGERAGGTTHGPFGTGSFLEWARARYFSQRKVGWVRGVGGNRWWKASDVFLDNHK